MKPVLRLIGECRIHETSGKRQRRNISLRNHLFLFLSQRTLFLKQFQFRLTFVQTAHFYRNDAFSIHRSECDVRFRRIVYHIFQHVDLLCEHCHGIIILHLKVFKIDIYTLHIHFHRHTIVEESSSDIPQFFQTCDIFFHYGNLLGCTLAQIIHFCDLHYQILACLVVRQGVYFVHHLGNRHGCIDGLVVERHLKLQSCRRVILQRLCHVVRITVCRAVGN